jgi:hypothetical protein
VVSTPNANLRNGLFEKKYQRLCRQIYSLFACSKRTVPAWPDDNENRKINNNNSINKSNNINTQNIQL